LEQYALASEKVGAARLEQDEQIKAKFLAGWKTTLNTNLTFATRARENVEKSRLSLDAAKAKAKGGANWVSLPGQKKEVHEQDESMITEEARQEIEQAEDEFVGQTEEAVGVMKNVR
jgi:Bin/amphiphysin/Rvs domain for vesicular trafficking